MKLISVLKTLLVESIFIDQFEVGGQSVKVFRTYESQRAISGSGSVSRVDSDEILDSMSDIYEDIVNYSNDILDNCFSNCSIVIRDYRLGFDYQVFIEYSKSGILKITINTSIRHPKKLKNDKFKSPEMIIQRDGDIILREETEMSLFTKIIKDNIIIYIKKL